MILAYWIIQWLPERLLAVISTNAHLIAPLLCYGIFLFLIAAYLFDPTLTSLRMLDDGQRPPPISLPSDGTLTDAETVRRAYQYLKNNWRYCYPKLSNDNGQSDGQQWGAFGLASGYSGPLVALLATLSLLFALLLGDGFAFSALTFGVVGTILMELSAESNTDDSLVFVITICELASHFFYTFGHQPTFATIPWEAAFVGIPGNFQYRWVQGAMVILRISSAHILVTFLIPLKAAWRSYRKKLGSLSIRQSQTASSVGADGNEELGTEADIIRRPTEFLSNVVYLNCAYLAASAVKVFCSTLASAVHRRHLMVWKVFAPKFIFDGIHFLVTCCSIIVQYLLVARLHSSLLKKFSGAEFVSFRKTK